MFEFGSFLKHIFKISILYAILLKGVQDLKRIMKIWSKNFQKPVFLSAHLFKDSFSTTYSPISNHIENNTHEGLKFQKPIFVLRIHKISNIKSLSRENLYYYPLPSFVGSYFLQLCR